MAGSQGVGGWEEGGGAGGPGPAAALQAPPGSPRAGWAPEPEQEAWGPGTSPAHQQAGL